MEYFKQEAYGSEEPVIEFKPGVRKQTLAYTNDSMLCRFHMTKGATIALHDHEAIQNGYIISGKLKFHLESGKSMTFTEGDGYIFKSWEKHGSVALEETDFIECFTPMRPEYIAGETNKGVIK